jgi:hypothetical protein
MCIDKRSRPSGKAGKQGVGPAVKTIAAHPVAMETRKIGFMHLEKTQIKAEQTGGKLGVSTKSQCNGNNNRTD